MHIDQKVFGTIQDKKVSQFVLKNDNGMIVKIMNYGATVTSIKLPSDNGNVEVVCGFDSLEGYFSNEYLTNNPYFGCVVGRYANRIKNGQFNIGKKQYELAMNNHGNHLHGGLKGFDKKIWKSKEIERKESVGVLLELFSEHMEEGYPGNVQAKVAYELNNQDQLVITYYAEVDQKTPLALTNHTYFNLSGFEEKIDNHEAVIHAISYLSQDSSNCVNGSFESTIGALDFSIRKPFSDALEHMPRGIDHYYIFNKSLWSLEKVAEFKHPQSDRGLEVYTDEPGMQFYTGYFISDLLSRSKGQEYAPLSAFCCETQRYPNGVNIYNSPKSFADENRPFESQTIYQFNYKGSKDESD